MQPGDLTLRNQKSEERSLQPPDPSILNAENYREFLGKLKPR